MQAGDISEKQRAVVKAMRDKLVQDGMFFVGIDVIGDKVIEINTESAGGLQAIGASIRGRYLSGCHRRAGTPDSELTVVAGAGLNLRRRSYYRLPAVERRTADAAS